MPNCVACDHETDELNHVELCEVCASDTKCQSCAGTGEIHVCRNDRGEVDYLRGRQTNKTTACENCSGQGYRI